MRKKIAICLGALVCIVAAAKTFNENVKVNGTITSTGAISSSAGVSGSTGSFTDKITQTSTTTPSHAVPNMTSTQESAIASPVEGDLVNNTTTHTLDRYRNSAWHALNAEGVSSFVQTLLGSAAASNFMTTLGFSSYFQTLVSAANSSTLRGLLGLPATNGIAGCAYDTFTSTAYSGNGCAVTHPSTGNFTVTFSPVFLSRPAMTVGYGQDNAASLPQCKAESGTGTSIAVLCQNSGGTATDVSIEVTAVGQQ